MKKTKVYGFKESGPLVVKLRNFIGYAVVGLPFLDKQWCGRYDTQKDAEDALRGLKRFIRMEKSEKRKRTKKAK